MTDISTPSPKTMLARAAALGLLVALTACQTVSIAQPGARPAPQTGLSGTWTSPDPANQFSATFTPGRFASFGTGNQGQRVPLAEGTVTPTGPRSVQMNWFSQRTGAAVTANCARTGREVLDCTPSAGTPFRLVQQPA